MTPFQAIALLLTVSLCVLIVARFRSLRVVVIGLGGITAYALVSLLTGSLSAETLGLDKLDWILTGVLALGWWVLMITYGPLADQIASYWFGPALPDSFVTLQQAKFKLIQEILIVCGLNVILEEVVMHGIVLPSTAAGLAQWLPAWAAVILAIGVSAVGTGIVHLYRGVREVFIVTQLSALLGIFYVISGYNLWAVILCHGLYETTVLARLIMQQLKSSD